MKSVTVHDTRAVTLSDLGANFYLTEDDVGLNRAEACRAKLAELNGSVQVQSSTEALCVATISNYNVLVLCESESMAERESVASACREKGVSLIMAQICGLAGMLFCDFGSKFQVLDKDGEVWDTPVFLFSFFFFLSHHFLLPILFGWLVVSNFEKQTVYGCTASPGLSPVVPLAFRILRHVCWHASHRTRPGR